MYVYTLFLTLWSSFSYVTHSTVNFVPYVSDSNLSPKTLEKSQNSKLKNIEIKQAPHWGPRNIKNLSASDLPSCEFNTEQRLPAHTIVNMYINQQDAQNSCD